MGIPVGKKYDFKDAINSPVERSATEIVPNVEPPKINCSVNAMQVTA